MRRTTSAAPHRSGVRGLVLSTDALIDKHDEGVHRSPARTNDGCGAEEVPPSTLAVESSTVTTSLEIAVASLATPQLGYAMQYASVDYPIPQYSVMSAMVDGLPAVVTINGALLSNRYRPVFPYAVTVR